MEDEFENLKPASRPQEMERWNVEDLKAYKMRLAEEISRIDSILDGKETVRSDGDALFNSRN
jgi:uncharacterized small protein (DUF1192 family)